MTVRLPRELYERLRYVAFRLHAPMSGMLIEGAYGRVAELEEEVQSLDQGK